MPGSTTVRPPHERSRVDLDTRLHGLAETLGRVEVTLNATVPHLATKAEVAGLRGDLTTEIANLRGQTTTALANLRGEMLTGFSELRREMVRLELRLVLWLGAPVVAAAGTAAGALVAALHHWPPH
jgi:hypothetical protein